MPQHDGDDDDEKRLAPQRGFAPARNRLDDFVQTIRPEIGIGV